MLQSGKQNDQWPTSGRGVYITPVNWGNPIASERGTKLEMARKWTGWLHVSWRLGGPQRFEAGTELIVAHKWAGWLNNPIHLGGLHRFKAEDSITRGPQVGRLAFFTPAARGVPDARERGTTLPMAHKWATWLHNPFQLGDPQCFRTGKRIRIGPQVGRVAA